MTAPRAQEVEAGPQLARPQPASEGTSEEALAPEAPPGLLHCLPCVAYEYKINHETGASSFPYVSDFCNELFGVPPAAVCADPAVMVDLVHPEDVQLFTSSVMASMQTLGLFDLTMRMRNQQSDKYMYILDRSTAHREQERSPEGELQTVTIWKGVLLEVLAPAGDPEMVKVQEEKVWEMNEWQHSPLLPWFSMEENGVIDLWSDAMQEVTGFKHEDVKGATFHSLLTNSKEILPSEFLLQLDKGNRFDCNLLGKNANDVSLILSANRKSGSWCVVCKDNTKVRELEKQRNEALVLAKSERSLTEWLSHEIRNPLSVVVEAANAMEDPGESKISGPSYLKLIRSSVAYVVDILTNTLDLNKLAEGKIVLYPQACNLYDDVILPTQEMMHIFGTVPLEVVVHDKGIELFVDKLRLRQVLTNLVSNSIKYTNRGFIRLSVHQENNFLEIKVSDSGIGIQPSDYGNLFSRYEKLGSSVNGAGLGLSLCKNLVALMKGDIFLNKDYRSGVPGQLGTQFVIRLPYKNRPKAWSTLSAAFASAVKTLPPAPPSPTTKIPEKAVIHGKFKILVVDDEKVGQKLLVRRFSRVFPEAKIDCSISGELALEMAKKVDYDLITMDHYMKCDKMNGEQTIMALRKHGSEGVIIGVSGNEKRAAHIAAGADGFFQKPLPSNSVVLESLFGKLPPPASWNVLLVSGSSVHLSMCENELQAASVSHPCAPETSTRQRWVFTKCEKGEVAKSLLEENKYDLVVLDNQLSDEVLARDLVNFAKKLQQGSLFALLETGGSSEDVPACCDIVWPKPLPSVEVIRSDLIQQLLSEGVC